MFQALITCWQFQLVLNKKVMLMTLFKSAANIISFPIPLFHDKGLPYCRKEEDIGYYAGYVGLFSTLFGLSVNYWMAICTRFLLGSFNGLLGPIKAYACEIFNKEYQALGLSTVSTTWGIGLMIGPALGGRFSYPEV